MIARREMNIGGRLRGWIARWSGRAGLVDLSEPSAAQVLFDLNSSESAVRATADVSASGANRGV